MLFIKHNLGFLWAIVETFNGWLFALRYGSRLQGLPVAPGTDSNGFIYRPLGEDDMSVLADFFASQPESQFEFFKPHGFDRGTLLSLCRNKAFLMYGTFDGSRLIGYYFLRCFFIGKAFRGKIVGLAYQGRGISKAMALCTTRTCTGLGLRQYETVSEHNMASIKSSRAVNAVLEVKKLKNSYLCVEYGPKQ